ncbi:linker for activation of T-cells family member 1 isoform X1 [Cuculus canorus]|uniref:linker for activation of T-cells family member 1 isoform X1 n=1 Tax=Cuculus canorus TaxID=55661 RepID=UPI0023AAF3E7|nr:linker for activation of T-cells family member 1 isoform X1 [Cuculus canorus]
MEAPLPHSGLWGLALLPPTLLLAALCARCRRGYGVQVDNYEYKPPHSVAPSSFIVMGPRYLAPHLPPDPPNPQPPPWGPETRQQPSPHPPRGSSADAGPPPPLEDDYTNDAYVTGYVSCRNRKGRGQAHPPARSTRTSPMTGATAEPTAWNTSTSPRPDPPPRVRARTGPPTTRTSNRSRPRAPPHI